MNRLSRLLAAAAVVSLAALDARAQQNNHTFNFNSNADGWDFFQIQPASGTSPWWQWHKEPSTSGGGLEALVLDSGSGAGAYAISPCLTLVQNQVQDYIKVDISHYTLLPASPVEILGQVQYRINTGTGFSDVWYGIPSTAWDPFSGHHLPTATEVFPPLLSSSGTFYDPANVWTAFSGTTLDAATGFHLTSQFTLNYADIGPVGVTGGDEIQFRLMVGVDGVITASGTTPTQVWEMNEFKIDGATLCEVPEPATVVLAGGAALVGLAAARWSRARRSRRRGTAWRHPGKPPTRRAA